MKTAFSVCVVAVMALYSFQAGPTPTIEPLKIDPIKPNLTVLNPTRVLLVNMIPYQLSDEQGQDSEPFLAVNTNETLLIGAAFRGRYTTTGAAALLLSSADRGWNWQLRDILPSQQMGAQSYCFSGKENSFYGSVLTLGGSEQTVSVFHTNDPATEEPLQNISTLSSGSQLGDAPFIQAHSSTSPGGQDQLVDKIFVGQNYFGFSGDQKTRTASIRVSVNDGKTFRLLGLEARPTGSAGQDGPAVRPSVAKDGTVYVAFLRWVSKSRDLASGDVIVSRDDNSAGGDNPFRDLIDPVDGLPGRMVTKDVSFSFAGMLGKQRVISPLSLAVDPNQSSFVYVAWGDYDAGKRSHVIHVRRSTDRGQNWSEDLLSIPSATNPSLAVSDQGVVGLLYQQLTPKTSRAEERWETHFRSSENRGGIWSDLTLTTLPTKNEPERQSDPYLGYRTHLLAVHDNFYGIFSASNVPDQTHFPQGVSFQRRYENGKLVSTSGGEVAPSIDPYFFRIAKALGNPVGASSPENSTQYSQSSLKTASWPIMILGAVGAIILFTLLGYNTFKSLRFDKAARVYDETLHGPALANYSGYVTVQFTDLDGHPIISVSQEGEFQTTVSFQHEEPQNVASYVDIDLRDGVDKAEIDFTVSIDSIKFRVERDHYPVNVPRKGAGYVTFPLIAPAERGEHSLFVQVYQRTMLVEVINAKILVGT